MTPKIRLPFVGKFPITFKFGEQPDWYVKIAGYPHNGLDFSMSVGTPILSCDDGKIEYADNIPDSDGLGVNIGHEWGLSQYWHSSKLSATYGQVVKKGDCIGYSGATGWATGPHLHFGVKRPADGPPNMRGWANPINYFIEPPYQPEAPVIVPRYYRVMLGDSLWKIAIKFYGEGYHWPKIYKANLDKIKHPSLIYPFQKLLIP